MGRTAPLTSKRCILYIYSTNVGTGYFKHALYSPFFFSSKRSLFHNANLFGSCIIHILYTGCAEIKKNNCGAKGLTDICHKYVAMIPRNLIVCIKSLCFGGKIFKNLISRENNTQKAPEVLLSADILYIVFNICADIVLQSKIRSYKGS